MCGKIFALIMLLIAVLLAITASVLPQEKLASVIYFTRFFDVMIPILAVAGLIKYLFSCPRSSAVDKK
jgi:hypothetical protein